MPTCVSFVIVDKEHPCEPQTKVETRCPVNRPLIETPMNTVCNSVMGCTVDECCKPPNCLSFQCEGSFVHKVDAENIPCSDNTCTQDHCCQPTCASFTCPDAMV